MRFRMFYRENFGEDGKFEGITYHIEVRNEMLNFNEKRKALRVIRQLEQSGFRKI